MDNTVNLELERRKRDSRPTTNHVAWCPTPGIVRWELKLRHVRKVLVGTMDAETARKIGEMYLAAARAAEGR